jgi:hypothetical protein
MPARPLSPLSLPLSSGPALSVSFLSHARPFLSLSRRPQLSARPQTPAHVPPPWTRPRLRDLQPHSHVLAPFEPRASLTHFPLLTCALSRTLSPPLSLCARDQVAPPPLTEGRCPFCDRRQAHAPSVASMSSASRWISGVRPRSSSLDLIRADLISAF